MNSKTVSFKKIQYLVNSMKKKVYLLKNILFLGKYLRKNIKIEKTEKKEKMNRKVHFEDMKLK